VGNATLRVGGELVHPDVLFGDPKLIIEFDGRATHDNPAQYLRDRERLNRLAAYGYIVLRFGWEHLDQPDYVVRTVRQALQAQSGA
jgi:very-short-patch-repair endonuclease